MDTGIPVIQPNKRISMFYLTPFWALTTCLSIKVNSGYYEQQWTLKKLLLYTSKGKKRSGHEKNVGYNRVFVLNEVPINKGAYVTLETLCI